MLKILSLKKPSVLRKENIRGQNALHAQSSEISFERIVVIATKCGISSDHTYHEDI